MHFCVKNSWINGISTYFKCFGVKIYFLHPRPITSRAGFLPRVVDETNGGVTPYKAPKAYAETGHYDATVVSSKALMSVFVCSYTPQFDRPNPYPFSTIRLFHHGATITI